MDTFIWLLMGFFSVLQYLVWLLIQFAILAVFENKSGYFLSGLVPIWLLIFFYDTIQLYINIRLFAVHTNVYAFRLFFSYLSSFFFLITIVKM